MQRGNPTYTSQKMQKDVYRGHQKVHAIKLHTVVTPKGIIANLYTPLGILYRAGQDLDPDLQKKWTLDF